MTLRRRLPLLLLALLAIETASSSRAGDAPRRGGDASATRGEAAHRLIVGWDDAVAVCGPGTAAGMDSAEGIRAMVKLWRARGIRGVYWRVDEQMLPASYLTRWPSKDVNPGSAWLLHRVDEVQARIPVVKLLLAAATEEGLEVWAWYPTIFSNGAPPEGPGFTHAWAFENRFQTEHPEIQTVDRAGNRLYGVWEYAHVEARRRKVAEFVEFAKTYGFRRFVACMRTEATQFQPAPDHADRFGFNAPIVEAMKSKHGIDIRRDPRFDPATPGRDPMDPALETWRKLRGGYVTELYRDLRKALRAVDPSIELAVQIPGERAGTCLGNWVVDWREWVDDGLVDELVLPVALDDARSYPAPDSPAAHGYLDASLSIATVRDYVRKSRHPTVRIIAAGGPATSFDPPPAGADGWRLDGWFDLWMSNMAERWTQWDRDVAELGHVRFLEQDFDDVPEKGGPHGGGYGDFCYRPDLRAAPGFWEVFGDGSDDRPAAQSKVRVGGKGKAARLTRAEKGGTDLRMRHIARHDRSGYPFPGDTAMSRGTCELEFSVYRPDATSGLSVFASYDYDPAHRYEIGLLVPEGRATPLRYRRAGDWVASASSSVDTDTWERVRLRVDLDAQTYGAEVVAKDRKVTVICEGVPFVLTHAALNVLDFSPQGRTGSVLYLDDVSIRWVPPRPFRRTGYEVARADFEGVRPGEPIDRVQPDGGGRFRLLRGRPDDVVVDNDLSIGPGSRSLRIRGGGGAASFSAPALTLPERDALCVEFDVFPRSDLPWVAVVPAATTPATDDVSAILATVTGEPVLGLRAAGPTWKIVRSGGDQDTGIPAAFDAWTRVQLVLDAAGAWRVAIRTIGESARLLAEGTLPTPVRAGAALRLDLDGRRAAPRGDGPAFDGIGIGTAPR